MPRATDRTERSPGLIAGKRPVLELLKAGGSIERILLASGGDTGVAGEIRRRAQEGSVPVRVVPRSEIEKAAGGLNHQGVIAYTGSFHYADLEQLLAIEKPMLLFLDGITDPHNLGSLLRSADGAGFGGVVLPARGSAGVTPTVRKVSSGASEVVPVARVTNLGRGLEQAKEVDLWAVGLDERGTTDLWHSDLLEPPLALVLGAEGKGISPSIRKRCDALVRIPMSGRLDSLNVGVAGALAMFEAARRRVGPHTSDPSSFPPTGKFR